MTTCDPNSDRDTREADVIQHEGPCERCGGLGTLDEYRGIGHNSVYDCLCPNTLQGEGDLVSETEESAAPAEKLTNLGSLRRSSGCQVEPYMTIVDLEVK